MTGLMRKRDSSGAIITPQSLGGYQPGIPDGQLRIGDFHCMQRFMGLIDLVGDL